MIGGVRLIGSTRAAVALLMEPVVAVVVAALVLGQRLTVYELAGGAAILAAVVLVVPLPVAPLVAAGFAAGRFAMPVLSNAWSDDGGWTAVWAAAQPVVRPLLALVCVGALAVATVTAWS